MQSESNPYDSLYEKYGKQYKVDPLLLKAQGYDESGFNPNAEGPMTKYGRAEGISQFIPSTAKSLGITNPKDPNQAIEGQAKLMAENMERYGTYTDSLNAYHGGTDKANWGPKTKAYSEKVLKDYEKLKGTKTDTPATPDKAQAPVFDFSKKQLPDKNNSPVFDFSKKQVPQSEAPGFGRRVADDITKRANEGADAIVSYNNNEQGLTMTGLDLAGKMGAGTIGDIMKEGGKGIADTIPKGIKDIASTVEGFTPIGQIKDAGKAILNTDIGKAGVKAAQQGKEAYDSWAKNNPNAARHVEAATDIAALLPGGKAASEGILATKEGVQSAGPLLEKGGAALTKAAEVQKTEAKDKFLHDLISPKETPSVKEANVGRTEEKGLFRQKYVVPTAREKEIAQTVGSIEGVSPKNSLQGNYTAIAKENRTEAKNLMKALEDKDIPVDSKELGEKLQETMTDLGKHPYIVGDAEKSAQRVMDGMVSLASKNPMTVSGLLKTRKEFDQWVERLKGEGIFTPKKDDPVTAAVHKIRQTLNDYVESKVPDVNYKASLRKQSNLYRAMDNLEIKAAGEGKNSISRTWQKAMNLIPGKNLLEKEGALGVGGGAMLLGSHFGVPMALPAAAGAGAYGLYKGATSPIVKKALGSVLSKTGQVIGKEKPLLRLTYQPKTDYIVGKDAVAEKANPLHNSVMDKTRERMNSLGLTSDVLHAQDLNVIRDLEQKYGQSELGKFVVANKNEPLMGKVWEIPQTEYSQNAVNKLMRNSAWSNLDKMQKERISSEIKQAWDSHQVTLADMIMSSRQAAKELAQATGENKIGGLGESLTQAASPIGNAVKAITP